VRDPKKTELPLRPSLGGESRRRKKAAPVPNSKLITALYDYLSVGLALLTGVPRGIAFFNEAFASMHGYEPGELSAVSPDELILADYREEWHAAIEGAQNPEDSIAIEIDRLRKDGSTFPALVRIRALSDNAEMRHLVEVHDRETQNTLLRSLNEDRTLLLASLEQLPVPIALLDPSGRRPLIYSRGLLRLFRDPASVTDAALENALQAIAEAVHPSSKESSLQPVVLPISRTGLGKPVAVEQSPILDAVGKQIGIVALLQVIEAEAAQAGKL
jgi:PAS domain S-box-containing protein